MYSRGETRFKPLALRGKERVKVSSLDRLCNLPGCNKYISAGEGYIHWGSFDLHVSCATDWCNLNGVEHTYSAKENS